MTVLEILPRCFPVLIITNNLPCVLDLVIVDIAVAHQCSAAVSSDGNLFTWGYDPGSGILGQQEETFLPFTLKVPQKLSMFSESDCKAQNVVFGAQHTLVLTQDHRVYAFGDDSKGQCGLGKLAAKNNPALVEFGGDVKVR